MHGYKPTEEPLKVTQCERFLHFVRQRYTFQLLSQGKNDLDSNP